MYTGFGVDQLRGDSPDVYWQSDGPQPHLVNIQFRKKTTIHDIINRYHTTNTINL
jgi:anaphase-promoting complex subunit 10